MTARRIHQAVVQVSRELAELEARELEAIQASVERAYAALVPDITGVRAVVARHSLVSFHRGELAP